jgi:hypothetical protein
VTHHNSSDALLQTAKSPISLCSAGGAYLSEVLSAMAFFASGFGLALGSIAGLSVRFIAIACLFACNLHEL